MNVSLPSNFVGISTIPTILIGATQFDRLTHGEKHRTCPPPNLHSRSFTLDPCKLCARVEQPKSLSLDFKLSQFFRIDQHQNCYCTRRINDRLSSSDRSRVSSLFDLATKISALPVSQIRLLMCLRTATSEPATNRRSALLLVLCCLLWGFS